jgi:hypothetical protein
MLTRYWFNQPSTLQPHHALHGTNVLSEPVDKDEMCKVYFLTGDTISGVYPKLCLSQGWRIGMAAARIKHLEFELGMLKIAHRHTQTMLAQCEEALRLSDYPMGPD